MRNRNGIFQQKRSVVEIAWAKNGTPYSTTDETDTNLTISDLDARTFNMFMAHINEKSGKLVLNEYYLFNDNTNTDYAQRDSVNGGADGTTTSDTDIYSGGGTAYNRQWFVYGYIINISGEEKLVMMWEVERGGISGGAGTAPERIDQVGKYDTTSNSGQFTQMDLKNLTNASYTNYGDSCNFSMLGTD